MRKFLLALALLLAPVAACGPPNCGPNQVAENDDDGWECEPDRNRNGVDDEDEDDD